MKQKLSEIIQERIREKTEAKAIIIDAFMNNEITEKQYKEEMNAIDLKLKELKL
tara:strand:+ start:195 stop:356 length:162 start_codon:yes stop_codon:yes gene_type:complete